MTFEKLVDLTSESQKLLDELNRFICELEVNNRTKMTIADIDRCNTIASQYLSGEIEYTPSFRFHLTLVNLADSIGSNNFGLTLTDQQLETKNRIHTKIMENAEQMILILNE